MMAHRDLIVVGASAGGVEALQRFVATLPEKLDAAILIVLHLPADGTSALPGILSRASGRQVLSARDGAQLAAGSIWVAPPDHHLVVRRGHLRLTKGPRVNSHRPAIDPLFFSAARWAGARAIGVVLSGSLDDGSGGLKAISDQGGLTIVQDPAEASYRSMPVHALQAAPESEVLPVGQMGARLQDLIAEPIEVDEFVTDPIQHDPLREEQVSPERVHHEMSDEELREANPDLASTEDPATEGRPSAFACPDCHGVLWELQDGKLVRFRCRVGHAFSPATLSSVQSEDLEEALWIAYRALRESAALSERLAERAGAQGLTTSEKQYARRAVDAHERAALIEKVLARGRVSYDDQMDDVDPQASND